MIKSIASALAAVVMVAAPAHAAVLTGTFDVTVVRITGATSAESEASLTNYTNALGSSSETATFTYEGELNFRTSAGNSTTIGSWLATGGGVISNESASAASVFGLTQSTGNINNGTATTTFYLFDLQDDILGGDFDITHDDGIALFEDGSLVDDFLGPVSETNTLITGFMGGDLELLYVATNSDPSILEVDFEAVPVPAALPLFVGGMSLFGIASRRRRKAA